MADIPLDSDSTKKRQRLMLGLILLVVLMATLAGVYLTGDNEGQKPVQPVQATRTAISTPGAQVSNEDVWMGKTETDVKSMKEEMKQLKSLLKDLKDQSEKQKTQPVTKSGSDVDKVVKDLERAKQVSKTPTPPAPSNTLPLPPGLRGTTAPGKGAPGYAAPGIFNVSVDEVSSVSALTGLPTKEVPHVDSYVPTGSFAQAVLLSGIDAPTGGNAQSNPQPVLLKLSSLAALPNKARFNIKECFLVGAGYGDISAERAYVRLETMSCVMKDGTVFDKKMHGFVAGPSGKAGIRGTLVEKTGQLLSKSLIAGVASGFATAFNYSQMTISTSPLGSTQTLDPEKAAQSGLASGVATSMEKLADYFLRLADETFPIIEVSAGIVVDVVITKGFRFSAEPVAPAKSRAAEADRRT